MGPVLVAQTVPGDPPSVRRSQRTVTLKFEDVVYKIKTKVKAPIEAIGDSGGSYPKAQKTNERTILNGVSGVVFPGEMLAMLGPSGSGKTTLLTALGGRLAGDLTGTITYNNKPFSNYMKRNMGFVTQDDVLYPHLTVTETLYYTALLRLPGTLTRRQKAEQAEAVMVQLGLWPCRDIIIGAGSLLRGVSGGERKRVSIGQEMLMNPSLIFLDEPTSGLDSTTAQCIVSTLWELAVAGRTVVMTIHQPSSRLFYMFHKILLMSDGSPIYFGKGSEAIAYFAGIGYAPSVAMNPSDFLLDLANGLVSDDPHEDQAAVKQTLSAAHNYNIKPTLREELREATKKATEVGMNKSEHAWCTSWWVQFHVLLQRDLKERRHEAFSGLHIMQVLIIAFVSGILWWQSAGHIQDQVGLLFFSVNFLGFFSLYQAIYTFPQERMMLAKERASGMYRLSSYFAARMVGDLPMDLVLPTVFTVIAYWMAGLKPYASNFFLTFSVFLLNVQIASGLGLALGAVVMDLKTASTLGTVIMMASMLLGGFYVVKMPAILAWAKSVSLTHHAFKLCLGAQFTNSETYDCGDGVTNGCFVRDFPAVAAAGLDRMGWSIAVLFVMLVFFRLTAYLVLTRVGMATG